MSCLALDCRREGAGRRRCLPTPPTRLVCATGYYWLLLVTTGWLHLASRSERRAAEAP
eukprot:CAMPEP_0197594010 /NCGR_PEP_ID=MMETSP1326-20131121/19566_1 /TAXON_ID=1155430 /ORGANISM="Genus nov. species nov., Strain RCC2288" /LENGTH=57 /DNA_ID=CAMNT_0043160105 /DNA_START=62 /DNA_END=232 /DNA_ORIENTATION=+